MAAAHDGIVNHLCVARPWFQHDFLGARIQEKEEMDEAAHPCSNAMGASEAFFADEGMEAPIVISHV